MTDADNVIPAVAKAEPFQIDPNGATPRVTLRTGLFGITYQIYLWDLQAAALAWDSEVRRNPDEGLAVDVGKQMVVGSAQVTKGKPASFPVASMVGCQLVWSGALASPTTGDQTQFVVTVQQGTRQKSYTYSVTFTSNIMRFLDGVTLQ